MSRRQHGRIEFLRAGQEIGELDGAVAGDTGDRCLACQVAVHEFIDHRFPEARLEIEHVMRDSDGGGGAPRVVNVLAGTAGALAPHRLAVIVELQRDADDVEARLLQQCRRDGGINAPRHGADHADRRGLAGKADRFTHAIDEGLTDHGAA